VRAFLPLGTGLAAAAIAYYLNWRFLRAAGKRAMWLAVPALEETLKSGLAALTGASLFATHVVFGAVEAAYEVSGARPSRTAALLSLVTHALFGAMTQVFSARSGLPAAFVAVTAIHAFFNLAVVGAAASGGRGD
jgi:hypothetical protein